MDLLILADCLWDWGGIVISLCIIYKLARSEITINIEDEIETRVEEELQKREEKYS